MLTLMDFSWMVSCVKQLYSHVCYMLTLIISFPRLRLLSPNCFSRAYVKKKGRNNVSVDDLVQVITPKGRGLLSLSIIEVVIGGVYHKSSNNSLIIQHENKRLKAFLTNNSLIIQHEIKRSKEFLI